MKSWKTVDTRYVVRDRWMTLRADRCETASSVVVDPYYVQELEDWVQIVAFDAWDRILVTRQYRHAVGLVCAELPCGVVERGETAAQAVVRELLEETGCAVDSLQPLPVLYPNPARCTNRIHPFIGTGARQIQSQQLDLTEEIEFDFIAIDKVLSSIDAGAFPQALHVASLLLALRSRGV
jgi:ADP-ribose diphosphatase